MAKLGIAITRRRLSELVTAARHGNVTIITRYGQPYAAMVPVRMVADLRKGPPTSLMALKGRAAGLWGKAPARTVVELRDEWPR